MSIIKKIFNWKTIKELFIYGVVGVCTTVINLGVYWLCTRTFNINPTISTGISWLVAVTCAYFADKVFVFRSMDFSMSNLLKEMGSFFGMRLISGLVDMGIFVVFYEIMGINDMVVKVGSMVIVIILNFIFSKFFIFTKTKSEAQQQAK